MARHNQSAIVLLGALCFLSQLPTIILSAGKPKFSVQGQIYCDVCRADFVNRFSVPMPGAKVRLECRLEEGGEPNYTVDGETDATGSYKLDAEGEWGDDLCKVTLVKSGRPDCDEIPDQGFAGTPSADITLTANNGFHADVRFANPLSFNAKKVLPQCAKLFEEIDEANNQEQ